MAVCCDVLPRTMEEASATSPIPPLEWFRLGMAAFVAGQTMIFGLSVNISSPNPQDRVILQSIMAVMTLVVLILAGGDVLRASYKALLEWRIVTEQLFTIGILGALATSLYSTFVGRGNVYYEVVSVMVAIYTFGNMLNRRKRQQALAAADILRREFDTCTRIGCSGREERVPVGEIGENDHVLVRQGEGIPVDGVVLEGVAFVRETTMTGEPFPVVKRPGDSVLAGSQLLDQSLILRSSTRGENRRLDELLRMVRLARERPTGIQVEADRITRYFLPLVVGLAIAGFALWTHLRGWEAGMFDALSVTVVACPCAMGLATPIGIWNALSALGSHGIVPVSGEWIERLSKVDTIVFDKTGTLSEDELQLIDLITHPQTDRASLLPLLYGAQRVSRHPVARAFHPFQTEGIPLPVVRPLPGIGVEAVYEDGTVLQIGNKDLLQSEDGEDLVLLKPSPQTSHSHEIYVRRNGSLVALAILKEKFRNSVEEILKQLEADGLRVEIMTGDRAESVSHLKLEHIHSGLLPDQKAELVDALQSAGRKVLFVGDGINDTAAISHSYVGLAMGSGSRLAQESAGAVMFGDDLSAVRKAVRISRRAVKAIRQNLFFAAGYNFTGITVALCGVLHPIAASLLMFVSSFAVTWNATRLGEAIRSTEK